MSDLAHPNRVPPMQIPTMIRQCGISGSNNRIFSGFREFLHTEVVLAGEPEASSYCRDVGRRRPSSRIDAAGHAYNRSGGGGINRKDCSQ
jgi:hypothetical protein